MGRIRYGGARAAVVVGMAVVVAGVALTFALMRRGNPPVAGGAPINAAQLEAFPPSEALEQLEGRLAANGPGRERSGDYLAGLLRPVVDGFAQLDESGRRRAVRTSAPILERFTPEGAADDWQAVLEPLAGLLAQALHDQAAGVRVDAVALVGGMWEWFPGRALRRDEEGSLVAFKERLLAGVVDGLDDEQPLIRAAAVAALGALPIDSAAAAGVSKLHDAVPAVRCQVLLSYAKRPDLLTDEDVLPLAMDRNPEVAELATKALKGRGLTDEQIGLGRLAYHPEAIMRASAVELIGRNAESIGLDPTVWLIHLSRDADESVRLKAVAALQAASAEPEVRARLQEMAAIDRSEPVRAAAKALLPEADATAALPALPGTPGLTPTAN